MQNKTRVIVCTNAFGMGIDKADVEFVVHVDVPDSLEAYFQEAGRAGRNEKKAYAILLFNNSDTVELEHTVNTSFPSIEEIRMTYQALANYYQIATGAGMGLTVDFDIAAFCDNYNLQAIMVFNSIRFLEREGYLSFTDAFYQPSKIKIELNRDELYRFQLADPVYDTFIKLLLRSHVGLFDNFVKISEYDLAKKLNGKRDLVIKRLNYLHQNKVLTYIPQTELPQITFEQPRIDAKQLTLSKENFTLLKKLAIERMQAMIHYASSTNKCRSQLLLSYFGETDTYRCNQCDVCLAENKKTLHINEFETISQQINELLAMHPLTLTELVNAITEGDEEKRIKTIQWLLDNDRLNYTNEHKLYLKK